MAAKRFPLPKRFNAALSEKAYEQLRALNAKYYYGNNYLLTIILENFDAIADAEAVERRQVHLRRVALVAIEAVARVRLLHGRHLAVARAGRIRRSSPRSP